MPNNILDIKVYDFSSKLHRTLRLGEIMLFPGNVLNYYSVFWYSYLEPSLQKIQEICSSQLLKQYNNDIVGQYTSIDNENKKIKRASQIAKWAEIVCQYLIEIENDPNQDFLQADVLKELNDIWRTAYSNCYTWYDSLWEKLKFWPKFSFIVESYKETAAEIVSNKYFSDRIRQLVLFSTFFKLIKDIFIECDKKV